MLRQAGNFEIELESETSFVYFICFPLDFAISLRISWDIGTEIIIGLSYYKR
jgi:hypothetical protein